MVVISLDLLNTPMNGLYGLLPIYLGGNQNSYRRNCPRSNFLITGVGVLIPSVLLQNNLSVLPKEILSSPKVDNFAEMPHSFRD